MKSTVALEELTRRIKEALDGHPLEFIDFVHPFSVRKGKITLRRKTDGVTKDLLFHNSIDKKVGLIYFAYGRTGIKQYSEDEICESNDLAYWADKARRDSWRDIENWKVSIAKGDELIEVSGARIAYRCPVCEQIRKCARSAYTSEICPCTRCKKHIKNPDKTRHVIQQLFAEWGLKLNTVGYFEGGNTLVLGECPDHGAFSSSAKRVIHTKKGCPVCGGPKRKCCAGPYGSKLETDVLEALVFESAGEDFEREKVFEDVRRVNRLPFDFYLPRLNVVIECHGQQHFTACKFNRYSKHELEERKKIDRFKYESLRRKGITMLVYTDRKLKYLIPNDFYAPVFYDIDELIMYL